MNASGVVLGFDFGARRIGTAVGNVITASARPLTAITGGARCDWTAINALVADWAPDRLLVGLPLTESDDTEQPIARGARRFSDQLAKRTRLPVERVDERFSTIEAVERLRAARRTGVRSRRVARGDADAVAAQIIVETWLAEHAAIDA